MKMTIEVIGNDKGAEELFSWLASYIGEYAGEAGLSDEQIAIDGFITVN